MSDAKALSAGDETSVFRVRTGKSVLREMGGSVRTEFYPQVLEPVGAFFSKAAAASRHLNINLQKTRFNAARQVLIEAEGEGDIDGSFDLHRYDELLCLTAQTAYFNVDDPVRLRSAMDLSADAALRVFSARIASMVAQELGGTVDNLESKIFPCLELVAAPESPKVPQSLLVELLTRHTAPSQNVIEEVFAKNRGHQVDGARVLLDRQGLVCYSPPDSHDDERASCARRFLSCSALIELAGALQRILRNRGDSELAQAAQPLLSDAKSAIPNSTSAARAWTLLLQEFSISGPVQSIVPNPLGAVPNSGARGSARSANAGRTILCIAAATIELSAVHAYLEGLFGSPEIEEVFHNSDYALRYADKDREATWYVVPLSFQGQVDAAVETKHLCGLIRPDLLLMVGMCMGMPTKGLSPGTVVIPNEVMVFDHERLTTEGVQHRPHGDRVDNGLFKFARLVAVTSKFPYKVLADKGLASATSKVEDPKAELVSFIQKSFPDAAAFDMEGWGFYRAGAGQLCLWIKAVADSGEPQHGGADGQASKQVTQADVTRNAIDFAVQLVDGFIRVPRTR